MQLECRIFFFSFQMQTQNWYKWKSQTFTALALHFVGDILLSAHFRYRCSFLVFLSVSILACFRWRIETTVTATSLLLSLWCSFPLMRFPFSAFVLLNTFTIRLALMHYYYGTDVPSLVLHIIHIPFFFYSLSAYLTSISQKIWLNAFLWWWCTHERCTVHIDQMVTMWRPKRVLFSIVIFKRLNSLLLLFDWVRASRSSITTSSDHILSNLLKICIQLNRISRCDCIIHWVK